MENSDVNVNIDESVYKCQTAKITANCKNCNQENRFEIDLSLIFDAIQRKHPSTKGPIESIYAIFEKEKHKMLTA